MRVRAPGGRLLRFAILLLVVLLAVPPVAREGTRRLARLAYPLHYHDALRAGADAAGLDIYLVAAVVRNESRFRPRAASPRGALGLMQVMPTTAREVAPRVGIAGFRDEMLYDPATNVLIGSHVLAGLVREFAGDMVLALAAYNAGRSTVRGWLAREELAGSHPATRRPTLKEIPFPETRDYVWRVLRDHERYRHIYAAGATGAGRAGRRAGGGE